MADYGASDTSTTTLGANQFPISEPWTPNAGCSAVEGGPQSTDSGGKKSAPVAVYTYDGDNVTFGAKNDAAATTDAGMFTFMALVKRLLGKLLVGQQTMAASVGVVIASDQTNLPGNTKQLNGTAVSVNAGNRD